MIIAELLAKHHCHIIMSSTVESLKFPSFRFRIMETSTVLAFEINALSIASGYGIEGDWIIGTDAGTLYTCFNYSFKLDETLR